MVACLAANDQVIPDAAVGCEAHTWEIGCADPCEEGACIDHIIPGVCVGIREWEDPFIVFVLGIRDPGKWIEGFRPKLVA
jgi:hypothetical protein